MALRIADVSLLTDREVLDSMAEFVKDYYGSQDWVTTIDHVAPVVGHAIGWNWEEVKGYLRAALGVSA